MYQYLNLHPQGKRVGDCVKRAIACATEQTYRETAKELNRMKKLTGCASFNDNKNWRAYLLSKRCVRLSFPAVKGQPRMNGERFCEAYPEGRYVLRMAKHLTACVDGVIYDTWDCSSKCVYEAYKVSE